MVVETLFSQSLKLMPSSSMVKSWMQRAKSAGMTTSWPRGNRFIKLVTRWISAVRSPSTSRNWMNYSNILKNILQINYEKWSSPCAPVGCISIDWHSDSFRGFASSPWTSALEPAVLALVSGALGSTLPFVATFPASPLSISAAAAVAVEIVGRWPE